MAKKGYTTETEIENYSLQEIDPSFSSQIDSWIEAMEKHIDQETGRNFVADETASERKFDGDGDKELLIDDCIEITKLEIDGEEIDATDYFTYPVNYNGEKAPITRIAMEDYRFTRGRQNVAITAKWGYSDEVPADISFACTVLVVGIMNEGANSDGEIKSLSMGSYSVVFKDKKQINDFERVKEILDTYKRMDF